MSVEVPVPCARAGFSRTFHHYLSRYPRDLRERVLSHAGIGTRELANPDSWIAFRTFAESLEMVATESREPGFGIVLTETVAWRDIGTLGYVIFNSPTVGTALGNACRYFALQQTAARPSLEVTDGAARLAYHLEVPGLTSHAQHSQTVLTAAVRICREGMGDPGWTPLEVHFKHSRPESTAEARRFFGCTLRFDQPEDAVVIAPAHLRAPMRSADPELLPIMLRHADERLAAVPKGQDFAAHVTSIVMSLMRTGDATIEQVAMRLGSSPRTIQRRLQDRGLSFHDVVANARLEVSCRYLKDPSLTMTDVAFLLGYSDLSAFSRAFRRWTGVSATEYRRGAQH